LGGRLGLEYDHRYYVQAAYRIVARRLQPGYRGVKVFGSMDIHIHAGYPDPDRKPSRGAPE